MIVVKIQDQHFNVWLFSNPGDKVKKDGELRDKSVLYFHQESGSCPLDWRITIHSNVDLVFLPDPRGAGLHEAFQISSVRPSVRPSVRT